MKEEQLDELKKTFIDVLTKNDYKEGKVKYLEDVFNVQNHI